MLLLTYVRQF